MFYLDLSYEKIYDNIFVYKNLFPDKDSLYETMKKSHEKSYGKGIYSEWVEWFIFGDYCNARGLENVISDIKEHIINDYDYDLYNEELNLHIRLNQSVSSAISHYIAVNNVKVPNNSYVTKENIGRYNSEVDSGEGKTMQYHTDYAIGEWYWPGEKFLITATTYMNDDYEGGGLMFSIGSEIISYKPKAGEVVVFPSGSPLFPGGEPYFHAVDGIKNGNKFLVRMYLRHHSEGHPKWYENEKKYGKEEWYEIAKKRSEGHNTIGVFEGKQRLCSSLITKLYGIDPSTYEHKENLFYDDYEIDFE